MNNLCSFCMNPAIDGFTLNSFHFCESCLETSDELIDEAEDNDPTLEMDYNDLPETVREIAINRGT